jgi:endonuclease/exonuclease/phosphatase (EEP) superfamily protein YafD
MGNSAKIDVAVEEALRTTLKNTTWETLGEALAETADRMQKGLHSPLDHLLVREAARRCSDLVKLAKG